MSYSLLVFASHTPMCPYFIDVSFVCRGLHLSTTKIQAMDVLLELSKYCSSETVLDRIVPYIVSKIIEFTKYIIL